MRTIFVEAKRLIFEYLNQFFSKIFESIRSSAVASMKE